MQSTCFGRSSPLSGFILLSAKMMPMFFLPMSPQDPMNCENGESHLLNSTLGMTR